MTEPLHFDCPFCKESIEVSSAPGAEDGGKIKCSGCQRKVEVPDSLLSELPDPDDDDDFLSGVPLKASDDDDILTEADLAIDSAESKQSADLAETTNPLDNDFEFSVVDSSSSAEAQPEEDEALKDEPSTANDDSDDSAGLEIDSVLDVPSDDSKTSDDEDLNQLIAGVEEVPLVPVEKGSFAIRCNVCDSRLLVSLGQVGKEVKCSDCFSMIKVREPTAKEREQIEKQIQLSAEGNSTSNDYALAGDGELTLAPLEDDEADEAELVAEIVEDDDDDEPLRLREEPATDSGEMPDDDFADVLLDDEEEDVSQNAPVNELAAADVVLDGEDDFADEVVDDLEEDLLAEDLSLSGPMELEDASFVDPAILAAAAAKKSKDKEKKKQASEGSEGKEKLNPYRSKSAQQAEKREQERRFKPKPKKSSKTGYPKLRFDAFFSAAVELVTEPSVAVRAFIAAALMAIGNVIAHSSLSSLSEIDAPTMSDTATMGFWRFGVGWFPYAIGTILLWYFCGVVFREAASGKKKIKSWDLGPTTEWSSTLLITAVSFAIAGAPALMLMSIYITAPVRFLLALPFLTAVWYVQSPFAIISSDVVMHLRKNGKQWKTVFLVVLALASIAFVAGVLMHVPVAWLNILTSALGAVFLSFVTLAFAAVAGWHSGMVVEELN